MESHLILAILLIFNFVCQSIQTDVLDINNSYNDNIDNQVIKQNVLLTGLNRADISVENGQSCVEYKMVTNYKRFNITMESLINIDTVVITDKRIQVCNTKSSQILNNYCSNPNNLCQGKLNHYNN